MRPNALHHHLPCASNSHGRNFSHTFGVLTVIVVMALLTIAPYPTTACTLQEELSLLEFLADAEPAPDAGGSLAASWLNGTDCCRWEGITCGRNETVTHVSLSSTGLQGRISPSLGNLTGLLHVNLSCNSLTGSLPVELLYSGSIVVIDVSFNRLSGVLQEIPSSTTKFRPLQVLNISWNFFRGHLPCTAWEVMNNLVELRAMHNSFTGQIPASFCAGSPSHFAVLDLSYNQFSGGIPAGLGNCSMLRVLRAGHNNLSGTIPHELFSASALEYLAFPGNDLQGKLNGANIVKLANLTVLDLGKNGLTGEIPDSIGQLKRLEELHLDHNSMSGELPPALGNCSNLKLINLRGNSFSGELAKVNFSTLSNLRILDLFSNNFTGTIPGSIYSCSNIVALRLSSNNFHGQLSPRIRNLKSLSFLSLANNSFTNIMGTLRILKSFKNLSTLIIGSSFKGETIPEDQAIDGFEKLRVLLMDNCQTSGEIPHWIENLTKLEILDLSNNRLIGLIPAWINRLHLLYYLDLSNNSLTGDIPIALMDLPMLHSKRINKTKLCPTFLGLEVPIYTTPTRQYTYFPAMLNLGHNNFTGMIPPEIGQLRKVAELNFSFNGLSGEIPEQICNLKNLQTVDLSNNHLTGTIPSQLNKLHFLSMFNVSNNCLEGPIPSGGQFDTFSNCSFTGNPKLCGSILIHHCNSSLGDPTSTLRQPKLRQALIHGIVSGGLIALALIACYLLASLVYDDRAKNIIS